MYFTKDPLKKKNIKEKDMFTFIISLMSYGIYFAKQLIHRLILVRNIWYKVICH